MLLDRQKGGNKKSVKITTQFSYTASICRLLVERGSIIEFFPCSQGAGAFNFRLVKLSL